MSEQRPYVLQKRIDDLTAALARMQSERDAAEARVVALEAAITAGRDCAICFRINGYPHADGCVMAAQPPATTGDRARKEG